MSKTEATAEGAAPKKSKKMVMILAVLLLGVAGGGGYFMMKPANAEEQAAAEAEAAKPEKGIVIVLDSVTVNLADGHYLKLKFSLQATADAGDEEMDGSQALDLAITQYTDKKIGELSTEAGRAKAKKELLERIAEAYEDKIMDLYYTEFVMQ
jgi:flagellar FliL protein